MTKEEAKKKLRASGYNVIDDNSVVTVIISPDTPMKNAIRDIKDKLNSWGYDASFGIRQHKGAEDFISDEEEAELNEDTVNEESVEAEEVEAVEEAAAEKEVVEEKVDTTSEASKKEEATDEDEYYDEEDSDMLLTEESIQFSLEDFGLDF